MLVGHLLALLIYSGMERVALVLSLPSLLSLVLRGQTIPFQQIEVLLHFSAFSFV